jgi:protein O-GlcNAc transferase
LSICRSVVGYVSSDFGNHPLSHLMQSVFGMHDRSKFEVTCYALTSSDQSVWRDKVEQEVEHFKDISLLHASDAAQLIYNDGIHVLVNLNGYTRGAKNEIFALHPAVIQVQFMGFCGTLGADYIHYMVADPLVVPQQYRQYYSEKMLYMPHSYFVNDHRQSAREVLDDGRVSKMERAKYGISEDKFVFCNFGQLYKIDPVTFASWMSILKRVPNSVMWLLRFPPVAEQNLLAEARKLGVREDQFVFSEVAPKSEHILRGFLADLFLDTPAYNAHTTACDILWSGTPLITVQGDKMATRVAGSILHAAGLDDLICEDLATYEEKAVELALDSEKLYSYRRHLEDSREQSPLFDTLRWVQNLENGFFLAWKKHELLTGLSFAEAAIVAASNSGHGLSDGDEDKYKYLLDSDDIVIPDVMESCAK